MSGPVQESARLARDEVRIELCNEKDSEEIAQGMYAAFPPAFWDKMEDPATRPPHSTRVRRFAARIIRPSISNPDMYWVKAVHVPTNTIMGVAGWAAPGHPLHSIWRPSAADRYKWAEKCNWSEADLEEMWAGVDKDVWETKFGTTDEERREVMGDEPHWYLAPLYIVPEFQGRGVSSKLLRWAIEQADKTEPVTPLYLEASTMGIPVYEHHGFVVVPVGEASYVRRGPKRESGDGDATKKRGIRIEAE